MAKPQKKSAKKKAAKVKPKKETKARRIPRTPRLPGMEDAGIVELEKLAEEYAEVRDERMALSKREGEMQDDLLALMKKHNKTEYHHEEVHCWIKAKEERVKVRIGELPEKATDFTPEPDEEEEDEEASESGEEFEAIGSEL